MSTTHGYFTNAMIESHLLLRNHRMGRGVPTINYQQVAVRAGYEDGANGMAHAGTVSPDREVQDAYDYGYALGQHGWQPGDEVPHELLTGDHSREAA